jgi:hypothetical protein
MAYTTDDDVRNYLSALGSASGGIGTDVIGTYSVSLAIAYSDSIVDLMLSKRYEVPFSPTPPAVKSISTTLTAWKSLRGIFTNEIPSALKFVESDYNMAMKYLEQLKAQEVDLPSGTSTALISERGHSTAVWSNTMQYTPIFDVDDELNQMVDVDRLDDIQGARE